MPLSRSISAIFMITLLALNARAADKPDADVKPDASKMPHMLVDVPHKQLRVECQVLNPQMPLEFFCCMTGTAEHEAVLRSQVLPSHLHLGLLMLGLQPGEPVRFSKAADKWLPPHGPPLQIFCEWTGKDGKSVRTPAYRMMRNVKTKKPMPAMTWIFAGSRVMEDGKYAADTTGYIVSVVNFDLTVIDIPELASSANETLEWEYNPDVVPPKGSTVWMVIEPAGKEATTQPAGEKPKADAGFRSGNIFAAPSDAAAPAADKPLSDVQLDDQKVKALRSKWEQKVAPQNKALRDAAQAHYEVINALRREQNRLIDEADRVQRVIDQLQKEYQDMTTPRPEPEEAKP
ncbi:MAG: hypothetical protein JWN40_2630 [Phycisphaerales bacterium]|nr:hypothetical protein [Phycisphaerales bacterium]